MDPTTLIAKDTLFTKNIRKRLDLASPTPLYHQLFVLLKGLILDGTLLFSQQMMFVSIQRVGGFQKNQVMKTNTSTHG